MYHNFGDVDFFESGILVDTDHSDTVFDMLLCRPYSDEEGLYQFAHVQVDLEDTWIDWDAIEDFAGIDPDDDPVQAAIACIEYYSWENFGAADYGTGYDWQRMTMPDIKKELTHYMIAWDELRAENSD